MIGWHDWKITEKYSDVCRKIPGRSDAPGDFVIHE
jgi:hypothetical protein